MSSICTCWLIILITMPRCPRTNSKYSLETVNNVKFLLKYSDISLRSCSRITKVPRSSVERIEKETYSVEAVEKRKLRQTHNRLLHPRQERIVGGWILFRCIMKKSSTTKDLKHFISRAFGITVKPPWISSFLKRSHLSLQKPSIAKGSELMSEKIQEAVECLRRIRSYNKAPSQIAVLDKTKFYNCSETVKHIGPKGCGRQRKKKLSRGSSITMYSLLVADGTLGPLYLETNTKKYAEFVNVKTDYGYIVYRPKNEKKRGEKGMLDFLLTCVRDGYLNPGDLLLTDNESSFKTDKVLKYVKKNKFDIDYFVSHLNHLMSPNDNYYHSSLKRRYWNSIDCVKNLNFQMKVDKIRDSFYAEKESSIRNYFRNCGIIGEEDPKHVMKRLCSEGLFPAEKFEFLHNRQLEEYIKWRTKDNMKLIEDFFSYYYPDLYSQK